MANSHDNYDSSVRSGSFVGPMILPGRGPVAMPMAMPGPPGGGMNRYREMTLEEMLLENRVLFLGGEINHVMHHASSCRCYTCRA